ncbi:MAG: hypothetical protein KF795_03200 [Labilithrix sp.]|nr:hypothetical protein [Labilithrix sp.]
MDAKRDLVVVADVRSLVDLRVRRGSEVVHPGVDDRARSRMLRRMEVWLTFPRRRVLFVCLAVSAVLCLPALFCGFFGDDHMQLTVVEGTQLDMGSSPYDLYSFGTGVPAKVHATMEQGIVPWWTDPHFKVRLFRPLSSALFALDHALFARSPVPYHVHQILWYLGLVAAAGLFFRRVLPGVTGGIALLLFAIDDAHAQPVSWIASRHALISALPCMLGLVAYLRFREEGWRVGRWLCLPAFAVGLLGGEGALGVMAYVFAYELVGARGSWRSRVGGLVLPALLILGYLVAYRLLGYGVASSSAYLDAIGQPRLFLLAGLTRVPTLVLDLLGGLSADVSFVFPSARPVLIALGVFTIGLVAFLLRSLSPSFSDAERRAARWLALGASLALLPAMGGFVGSRVLLPASIGGAGLLALLLRHGWLSAQGRGGLVRIACRWYAFVHLVLAPAGFLLGIAGVIQCRLAAESAVAKTGLAHTADLDVFVLNASDPMIGFYGGVTFFAEPPPRIRSCRLLSMAKFDHAVTRTGARSFELAVVDGRMLDSVYEGLFRASPILEGEEVRLGDARVRVLALRDGKPARIEVTTARPLDDPSYAFVTWQGGALERVDLSREGETLHLRWSPGPIGL